MKCVIPASCKQGTLYKNTIKTLPLLVGTNRMLSVKFKDKFTLVYILIRTSLWTLNPQVYLFIVYLMRLITTQAGAEELDD